MRRLFFIALLAFGSSACHRNRSANSGDASTRARAPQGMCGLSEVHEVCNGLDDDCNGVIDDNAQCPAGQHCVASHCQ